MKVNFWTQPLSLAVLILCSGSFASNGSAQSDNNTEALERVSEAIKFLASDELEGRGVNTKGLETAGQYIIDEYKSIGLKPMPNGEYRQELSIDLGSPSLNEKACSLVFKSKDSELKLTLDKDFSPQINRRSTTSSGGLVFVGYGINADDLNYNEYANVDVTDKFVVVLRKEPQQNDAKSVFNGTEVSDYAYVQHKVDSARDAGAAGIIFVNDGETAPTEEDDTIEDDRGRFNIRGRSFPFAHVKRSVINQLLEESPVVLSDGSKLTTLESIEAKIDETLEPLSADMSEWQVNYVADVENQKAEIYNVVGMLEGTGPNKDEIILVGGHYDHLGYGGYGSMAPGRNEIHNGADDNASGTVAIIELARRFATGDKKPNRTMVFVCFSGEERGLHGSSYYANNPVWPLEKTVTMINFDMIGYLREGNLSLIHGQSGDVFEELMNKAAEGLDLNLDIGNNAQANSDHFPFYQKQVPDVFVHTGITPVLHTPEDDFELLNMEGAMRVIDFVENFMEGIDGLENAPEFVDLRGGRNNRLKSSFGAQLDFEAEAGATVLQVNEGSAAEKAGIQKDDVLVYFGTTKVTSRRVVMDLLRNNEPGTKIEVKLQRGEELKTIELELGDR